MTKKTWKTRIKKACKEAGTYKPCFDHAIDALSGILERRDSAQEQFDGGGEPLVMEMTNKSGHTNMVKNPLVCILDDLDRTALTYWRDLGLTPAGLKKIMDEGFAKKKEAAAGNDLFELLKKSREGG